jgi:hypothetical protein
MKPSTPLPSFSTDRSSWPKSRAPVLGPYGVSLLPGDLVQHTWKIWQREAVRLTLVTALPYCFMGLSVVLAVVAFFVVGDNEHWGRWWSEPGLRLADGMTSVMLGSMAGLVLTSLLLFYASYAGGFLIVEELLRKDGRPLGAAVALLGGVPYIARLALGHLFVIGGSFLLLAPGLGGLFAALLGEGDGGSMFGLSGLGLLLLACFPLCWLWLRVAVAGPVIVAENVGILEGLRRALALTRGRTGEVFVACLVFFCFTMAVQTLLSLATLIPLLGLGIALLSMVVVPSLQMVFLYVLYAALRDREAAV